MPALVRGRPARSRPRSSGSRPRTGGCVRTTRSCSGDGFLRRGTRPPQPLIMAFIDDMRSRGSRGRVDLSGPARAGLPDRRADLPVLEAGQPPGRGPHRERRGGHRRAARGPGHPRGALRSPQDDPLAAPPGPRGRVLHRRPPDARPGHERGPARQGRPDHDPGQGRAPRRGPAGPRLHRTGTQPRWVADFTYCRTWAGFVYVAFIVDVFAQRIVGWHAATDRRTDLVLTPLRIALWDRDRQGTPSSPAS